MAGDARFDGEVIVEQRLGACALFAFRVFMVVTIVAAMERLIFLASLAAAATALCFASRLSPWANIALRARAVRLIVENRRVRLGADGRRWRVRGAVAAVGGDGVTRVTLHRPLLPILRPPVVVRVRCDDDAEALLASVGAASRQRALYVRGMRGRWWLWAVLFAGSMACFVATFAALWSGNMDHALLFEALTVVLMYGPLVARTCLIVGADGILTKTRIGATRFVPFAAVRDARLVERGIAIDLVSGGTIEVPLRGESGSAAAVVAAVARIRERVPFGREPQSAAATRGLLSRGERSTEQWLRALRAIGAGRGVDYRTSFVDVDGLRATVQDASFDVETRVGAALALREASGAAAVPLLRVVAETSASTALRSSIARIVREDDDLTMLDLVADHEKARRAIE